MTNLINELKIDSLPLSAYLLCNSLVIKRVESSPIISGKYLFVFDKTERLVKLMEDFSSYKAIVTPQAYYQAVKEVKRMLIEYKSRI